MINEAKGSSNSDQASASISMLIKGRDLAMAGRIVTNAKTSRPGVCNAVETLLVHEEVAPELLPDLYNRLKEDGVQLRGCPRTKAILPEIAAAEEADWYEEYLDYILAVKVVSSFDEAVRHINTYGTKHSKRLLPTTMPAVAFSPRSRCRCGVH